MTRPNPVTAPDPSTATAAELDAADCLAGFRQEFELPDGIYLVGNSLGALPAAVRHNVTVELDRWSTLGVEGHFTGELAWKDYHELLAAPLATLVGAGDHEVVAMNALTVNLHLLMVSFYRPTPQRHKIIIEEHAFPSDHFATESQIRQRGGDPATSLITLAPRPGEQTLRGDDILDAIEQHGDELATILLPGVQYYTGQVLPMAEIAAAGHAAGATVGLDLAHAVGNIELALHDWNVDFAAWCSYKYLNSSPGGVAGLYVHERHHGPETFRLAGWWGHDKASRFKMPPEFVPERSAESWQWSNAPVLGMAAQRAALDVFDRADLDAYRAKSLAMTDVLLGLLDHVSAQTGQEIKVLTPREPQHRGSQVSVQFVGRDRRFFDYLVSRGVYADWREPGTVRMAVAPLYSSYRDLARLEALLTESLMQ